MINRALRAVLLQRLGEFPVVTLTGPRQSGKTTLCRDALPDHRYVSLEPPDVRARAAADPRGFLSAGSDPLVIDEVQRVPELVSYVQDLVDRDPRRCGRFVLTGSENLAVSHAVSQSLAGRTALLELLPLSQGELAQAALAPSSLLAAIVTGGYPAIHDRGLPAATWLSAYAATYLERDVRAVRAIGDLRAFQRFLELAAGRTGQLVVAQQLGADVGVAANTARDWLSVLAATYVAFELPAFHANLRKRLVKVPKLHFYDSGLACWLLGIHGPGHLASHPLRGALFESWVVAEIVKHHLNAGIRPRVFHYRDRAARELDLMVEGPDCLLAVEIKAGATFSPDWLRSFAVLRDSTLPGMSIRCAVVYGGDVPLRIDDVDVIPWNQLHTMTWPARAR